MKEYVRLAFQPPETLKEILIAELFDSGCLGISEKEDGEMEAFFTPGPSTSGKARAMLHERGLFPELAAVRDRDWLAVWRKNALPVALTKTITVYPRALPARKTKDVKAIVIPPKMSFGTGHHESTRLCARLIEREAAPGRTLLDVGTGSGILAIAAEKSGFASITALDNDPVTTENIAENVRRNRCRRVFPVIGTLESIASDKKFDVVCANIQSSIILALLPGLLRLAGRSLVFGGILKSERKTFLGAVAQSGAALKAELAENEWMAAVFSKE